MMAYMKLTGAPYLNSIIKPFVIEILHHTNGGQSYEIDATKATNGNMEGNLSRFDGHVTEDHRRYTEISNEFPMQLHILSAHLGNEVQKKFPNSRHSSVGGFLFLRFINPAILSPFQNGLVDQAILDATRPVVLTTKLLQNLANGIEFNRAKEPLHDERKRIRHQQHRPSP